MKPAQIKQKLLKKLPSALPPMIVILLLFAARSYSYLLFHTTVEAFSFVIAICLFLFAWNTRKIVKNHFFLFLGIVFLYVGLLDFVHSLSYKGMNIFQGFDANLPTQLWVAGRYILSVSFLISPVFIEKKLNYKSAFIAYTTVTVLILISIFKWKIFPDAYIEGVGLTVFKRISEFVFSLVFLGAILKLNRKRGNFDPKTFRLLTYSLTLNIIAGLLFTLYFDVYDIFNMLGHTIRMGAYYLVYKATIEIGLTRPYNLLFLELENLNKRKDEFINIAGHELKTPVTSIKLYSQLLGKELSRDSQKVSFANKIDYQADRMTSLINEILDISRIEKGNLSLEKRVFDINELAKLTIDDIRQNNPKHKLIFKGGRRIEINADILRVSQVLTNLINNAIKYSPEGKRVIVGLQKNGKEVVASVKDFGVGIPKTEQEKIFDKFYRIEKEQKNSSGFGLGLYIVKEIIEGHGGKIWVESKEGKGSTFYFTLPLSPSSSKTKPFEFP
ncbi:hypothetical protein C4578_00885 [Candidatus Microgenomates bacterium]|jgi:signal transduction histidine kinase|nr:MAG: hypothetical protein C4578_00885 [Candidatus Microgenomates bacterium]